jgi:hypothetical protein
MLDIPRDTATVTSPASPDGHIWEKRIPSLILNTPQKNVLVGDFHIIETI